LRSPILDCKQTVNIIRKLLSHLRFQHGISLLRQFGGILPCHIGRHYINSVISLSLVPGSAEELEERYPEHLGIGIEKRHLNSTACSHLRLEYSAKSGSYRPVFSYLLAFDEVHTALQGGQRRGLVLSVDRLKRSSLTVTFNSVVQDHRHQCILNAELCADGYPEWLFEIKIQRLNNYLLNLNCFHFYPSIVLINRVTD